MFLIEWTPLKNTSAVTQVEWIRLKIIATVTAFQIVNLYNTGTLIVDAVEQFLKKILN